MIKFHCSKCNKKIAVSDESVGKRCQCPKCKTISVVPDTSSSTEMSATDNLVHFKCSRCKQELEAPEVMRGKTILCHHCQANTVVSEHESQSSENDGQMPFKLKEQTKDCPYCGEEILMKAIKCKHCGEFLESDIDNSYQPSFHSTPIQKAPNITEDFNWKPILYLALIVGGIISVLSLSSFNIKEFFQDSKSVESNTTAQAVAEKEMIEFHGKLLTPEEYAQERLRAEEERQIQAEAGPERLQEDAIQQVGQVDYKIKNYVKITLPAVEEVIRKSLKAPLTAIFTNTKYHAYKTDNEIKVLLAELDYIHGNYTRYCKLRQEYPDVVLIWFSGDVSAHNSFGAMVQNHWFCSFLYSPSQDYDEYLDYGIY